MIKAHFTREKLTSLCFIVGIEYARVPVTNHKTGVKSFQPTLTFGVSLIHTAYYLIFFRPAKVALTRGQRRHFKLQ